MDRIPASTPNTPHPPIMQLALLLFLVIMCGGLGGGFVQLLGQWWDMEYSEVIAGLLPESSQLEKNFTRISLAISHLMTFIVPALLFMWTMHQTNWSKKLLLKNSPSIKKLLLGAGLMLVLFPVAQGVYWLNKQLPIPAWASQQESLIQQVMESLLAISHPYELIGNIVVIGVLPAIGEELVFRGIIQQKLAATMTSPAAIWVTAFIFSAIHLQFEGFFPRLLLGAALGYLLVWTQSLWVPIFAHFVFNTSQVLGEWMSKVIG